MSAEPGPALPEDRYTASTPSCPHPERWTSTDEHSAEVEVGELIYGLVRGLQPSLCLETGTAWGVTAEMIGQALALNGHGRLVTLEPDPERATAAEERCAGLPVQVVASPSLDLSVDDLGETVEFAFFDSLFPLRSAEYLHFRPAMRRGTIVGFHDSAPDHGGGQFSGGLDLRGDLERLAGEVGDLRLIHLPTPRGITLGEVT